VTLFLSSDAFKWVKKAQQKRNFIQYFDFSEGVMSLHLSKFGLMLGKPSKIKILMIRFFFLLKMYFTGCFWFWQH